MNIWDKAIKFLVSSIGQSAVDAWRQTSAIDADLSNLQAALPKARLLIERTECWRSLKYHSIGELLPQLIDVVYEAESIVDELEYQRLRNEVEKSFPGSNFFENWIKNFPYTVKSVLQKLDYVYDQLEKTCNCLGIPEKPNKFSETARPVTSTFINNSEVYGRGELEEQLISLLTATKTQPSGRKRAREDKECASVVGESSHDLKNKENMILVSIIGMGGVGKTTLAQLICNNRNVKSYFELILWVCISDNFDVARLTKEIIECAKNKECNLSNMNSLQLNLEEILQSKRFLLVLDDAWSESEVNWKSLLGPVRGGFGGSAVLVTTRSKNVAEIAGKHMDSTSRIYLEGLEENVYWDFFKSCAFGTLDTECNPELEKIGKEICKKLKGSPLAAKTIGGLLRVSSCVEHWNEIRESKMWQLDQEEHDILPVLQLSYQYLPSHLKRCFSFCSLFPKDFKFEKAQLIKFWIMHGFINFVENTPHVLRVKTEYYFNELERRCFFQRAPGSHTDSYVIHDLMHDVCQSITKDECFCIESGDFGQRGSLSIRHVSIHKKLILEEQTELCKYKKLLSVSVANPSSWSLKFIKQKRKEKKRK